MTPAQSGILIERDRCSRTFMLQMHTQMRTRAMCTPSYSISISPAGDIGVLTVGKQKPPRAFTLAYPHRLDTKARVHGECDDATSPRRRPRLGHEHRKDVRTGTLQDVQGWTTALPGACLFVSLSFDLDMCCRGDVLDAPCDHVCDAQFAAVAVGIHPVCCGIRALSF